MSEEDSKIILRWNHDDGEFEKISAKEGDGVFMELKPEENIWFYSYQNATLIARRTSERKANGISKTGWVDPTTGIRHGVEFKLVQEKSRYEDLSDDLKKKQRAWYGGEYRED
jgi:hypothetical protein